MKFSTVQEALSLLGITDHEDVKTVVITPHNVTVIRLTNPRQLDDTGEIVTSTEITEVEY